MLQLVIENILFLHAWSGCDTTSATFGQGKTAILKKLKQSVEIQNISIILNDIEATPDTVGTAGCQLFVLMYGGNRIESLNTLRYVKYMEMVASSKKIEPQKLPPTPRAAYFHSLRVHHQIMIWNNLSVDIDPTKWGWKLDDKSLQPIMTDLEPEPAPEFIISLSGVNVNFQQEEMCFFMW